MPHKKTCRSFLPASGAHGAFVFVFTPVTSTPRCLLQQHARSICPDLWSCEPFSLIRQWSRRVTFQQRRRLVPVFWFADVHDLRSAPFDTSLLQMDTDNSSPWISLASLLSHTLLNSFLYKSYADVDCFDLFWLCPCFSGACVCVCVVELVEGQQHKEAWSQGKRYLRMCECERVSGCLWQ